MRDPRPIRDLERLKWMGVVVPIALIWAWELARYVFVDGTMPAEDEHILSALILAGGIVLFGIVMAILFERTQRGIVRQNLDLTALTELRQFQKLVGETAKALWRAANPGEPYYVHFQTTDVHMEHHPVPPFAGLFISSERRRLLDTWKERLGQVRQRMGYTVYFREFRRSHFSSGRNLVG